MCGFVLEYELPQAQDKENDKFTITSEILATKAFTIFEGTKFIFSPKSQDIGTYAITVNLESVKN